MKVVIDTNVLIAAFIARGTCHELFEHCTVNHTIVLSDFILNEFETKLVSKLKFTEKEAVSASRLLRTRAVLIPVAPLSEQICRDQDDDNILALSKTAAADCILTGDKDLLDLREHWEVPIVAPGSFWQFDSRQ